MGNYFLLLYVLLVLCTIQDYINFSWLRSTLQPTTRSYYKEGCIETREAT